ncbi:alcohol dehydrogenase catalytic domain-containing protein [Solirubrobacter ginsenosidimutans]|uniref:Alcohol dehydrogenase catalytic domain-containing protein n=1 Tax=Solirubrobacter ginsenosidimutans TaxID=490573 RepID=A0A9X3MQ98_9ACTN|nr:alcohol dehydrogenase catalytic domain-containing protein [Solirubrobacter ginsenosidimutans]MDA0160330.1 alcohol dehydrogenase catalytic domain-containing protein [Solirubrobacter ginsenosidimutans]
MRAVRWQANETLELADLPEPTPEPGQAVVEIAACGICGSDLHTFAHGLLAHPGMVLGHEFAGTVLQAPGVDGLEPGQRVTARALIPCGHCDACWAGDLHLCAGGAAQIIGYGFDGAFSERVLIPRAIVGETVFALPDNVSDEGGALVEPLAVALRAVRRCGDVTGKTVLVLGAGMIGLGATRFLKLAGAQRIVVADLSALRREAAIDMGAHAVVDPTSERPSDAVGRRADVVLEAAGAAATLSEALRAVRPGGIVTIAAVFGRKIEVPIDRFTEKELDVRGSFAYRDEFPAVIEALASGDVDADTFISHRFSLADAGEAFRTQLDKDVSLKVLVTP